MKYIKFESKSEYREILDDLQLRSPYNQLYGILYTEDLTVYVVSLGMQHHFLAMLIIDYNGHRYKLLGRYQKNESYSYGECYVATCDIKFIIGIDMDTKVLKKMMELVYKEVYRLEVCPNLMISLIKKPLNEIRLKNAGKAHYGVRLF